MIGMSLSVDQATYTPSSPLFPVFHWGGNLAGVVLVIGLYVLYRSDSSTLSLVAAMVSWLGYLLFSVASFGSFNPGNPLVMMADVLVYIVGVFLFSWLAYDTHRIPRSLAVVGFLASAAGVSVYALKFGAGVEPTNPNHPLIGAMYGLYFAYLLLVLVWLGWTGYSLTSGRAKTATA